MTISNSKFNELKSFTFHSKFINLTDVDNRPDINTKIFLVLPGTYRVLENLEEIDDKYKRKVKEVYIIHDSINLKESINTLSWKKAESFTSVGNDDDYSVAFLGESLDVSKVIQSSKKDYELIQILEKGIALGFLYNDTYGINYSTVEENGVIKAFKIQTDTLSNELSREFHKACESGDIIEAKRFMDIHGEKINVRYDNAKSFYFACRYGYEEVIKYLMFSPDLKEHITMSHPIHILELFANHLKIVESLIFEYDMSRNKAIDNFLFNSQSQHPNAQLIENLFKMKEVKNNHDALENTLPKKNGNESIKVKI